MRIKSGKLLIVGGFPPSDSKVRGGVITSCQALIYSELIDIFDIVLLDSSQKTMVSQSFFVRFWHAIFRMFRLLFLVLRERPNFGLLFCSDRASFFEKATYSILLRLFQVPSYIFPRSTRFIDDTAQSKLFSLTYRFFFKAPTGIFCQGYVMRNFLVENLKVPARKIDVVFNWTADPQLLSHGHDRTSFVVPGNRFIFVGWLEIEKGVWELLEAFSTINSDFSLEIVGVGTQFKPMSDFVDKNGLSDRIVMRGRLQKEELYDLYQSSDVLILPSYHEGFPNVAVEAMSAGLLVVVSRVGNIPGVLTDLENSILIEPKSIAALKEAIDFALHEKKRCREIAQTGNIFADKNFTVSAAVKKITKFILEQK